MGSGEVIMRQLALFFAVLAVVTCYRSYHGYKVLRTEKLSFEKMELLKNFQIQSNLDFWKEPWLGQPADIMVPASKMFEVNEWLSSHNIKFSIMVENVQDLVELSQPKNSSARGMFDWTDYYPHDDLNPWIAGLADANDFARIINIGKSYEGRDMNVLAIEKAGAGAPNVWLEQVSMPESGFPQLLPPLLSIIYWRATAKTPIIWTKSIGTSFPQQTLMVTLTHLSKTECGERQDHLKEDALVLTPTETGTFTGEKLV